MQQDLLAILDEGEIPVATTAIAPIQQPVNVQPRTEMQHRVSDCRCCGGSGACSARSIRSKTIPCICCSGIGKTMHDAMGRRIPLRTMVPILRDIGVEIPEHAAIR